METVNRFLRDSGQDMELVEWVLFDDRTYQAYEQEVDKLYRQ